MTGYFSFQMATLLPATPILAVVAEGSKCCCSIFCGCDSWNCWIENQILLAPDKTLLLFVLSLPYLCLFCQAKLLKVEVQSCVIYYFCHGCEHAYSGKRGNTLAVFFFFSFWIPLCKWIKIQKKTAFSTEKSRVWFIAPWSTLKRWRQVSLALWLSGFISWYIAYFSFPVRNGGVMLSWLHLFPVSSLNVHRGF